MKICDDDVEICDANFLWGRDIYETTEALWRKHGRAYSIIAIGQAGENLVRLALGLVDKMSTLGKGGLAAVMGSKNLKAIAVTGTRKKVKIAEPRKFERSCDEVLSKMKVDAQVQAWTKLGKMASIKDLPFPYENYTKLPSSEVKDRQYGIDAYLRLKIKRRGCTTCAFPCKDEVEVPQGEYKGLTTNVSSLVGRIWNLGFQNTGGSASFEEVIKLFDVANRYGIDCHVFSPVMDFAVELYERGIITDKDTEGLVLKRDFATTLTLLEQVTHGQGIGAILGEGSLGIISKFGKECEKYSTHIKNLEQHKDPREAEFNMCTFGQVVSPEGGEIEPGHIAANWGSSQKGYSLDTVREYCKRMDLAKDAIARIFDVPSGYNVARLLRYAEDFFSILTSLGICEYRTRLYDWDKLAGLYSAATGIEMSGNDMKKAGERIWHMFKALNVREGFDRKDDRFPPRWLEPFRTVDGREVSLASSSGEAISVDFFNKMLDDYYDKRLGHQTWDTH